MIKLNYDKELRQELKNLPFELSVNDMGMIQYYYNYFCSKTSNADFTPILKQRIEDILRPYQTEVKQ
jgi:hypothetical protein